MTENSPAIKDETAIEQVRAIIRPELNIEKHADFIFAPSHSKRIREPRKKMWATEIEGGRKAASYLLIEPIYGGKTPTTKTRKVYLVLVKLWEARTRDDDVVVFSVREIADELDLHESTISRVTTNKYMLTPRGIFELKYFFGSSVATDTGGTCSATAIRALIKQLVDQENPKKPYSDNQITELLAKQGIVVARRTIAKYRESLNIAPASLRKSL